MGLFWLLLNHLRSAIIVNDSEVLNLEDVLRSNGTLRWTSGVQ